jgi:hypothetical protein
LGDPLEGNLLLFYKPLHLEAQQVSTRIEVRRHHQALVFFTAAIFLTLPLLFTAALLFPSSQLLSTICI